MSSVLDQDTLNSLRELASPDQPDLLKQLFTLFTQTAPARVKVIQSASGQNDFSAIAREAHTLKSSSANIGALEVSQICQALEKAARSSDVSIIQQEVAKLQPALESVVAAVAQLPEMG